jgi:anti-anti-sigma factor
VRSTPSAACATTTPARVTRWPAAIEGEIDCATAPLIEAELRAFVDDGFASLVLDLSGVVFLGAAGLHLFVDIDRRMRQNERRVDIVCPNPCQRRIFAVTGVDRTLTVHLELDTALIEKTDALC